MNGREPLPFSARIQAQPLLLAKNGVNSHAGSDYPLQILEYRSYCHKGFWRRSPSSFAAPEPVRRIPLSRQTECNLPIPLPHRLFMLEETQQLVTDDDSKQNTSQIFMSPQQPTDNPTPVIASSASASHQPPVFNILVAGQPRIGKTGLLKLLLDTSSLSSTTSLPRIACLAEFASYAGTCPTTSISCATADLPASDHQPEFVLNMIDTPGLLFHDPQELEKGVNLLLRQITDSFDASQAVPVSGEYSPSEVRLKPFPRHRNGRTNICTCRSQPN